ncbi:hypothetical protein ABET51_14690 [Metabacillus fastidiosus]|uniref:peptidase MA family metallohydrolase n=1 Tax=Metabacillus fastidiosus TaxID=1458 RepID=UPI002E1C5BF8|nr:hypothetical protein [Metabacillus fastidiosus]
MTGSVFLIITSAALSFLIIMLFSINMIIMTKFGKSMTFQDKIELFSVPLAADNYRSPNYEKIKQYKETEKILNMTVYHQKEESELLPIIESSLTEAKRINDRLFEKNKDREINLILHNSKEDLKTYTSLVDTLGYYDDTNAVIGIAVKDYKRILTKWDAAYAYFHSTIMHEYTHYRLQTYIKANNLYVYRIPLWFHEGVSEYVGMKGLTYPYYSFEQVPLKRLASHEQWETYRIGAYDIYAQSYFAINYLVEQYGEDIIPKIIRYTAQVNDFNQGFKKATGLSVNELDALYMESKKRPLD